MEREDFEEMEDLEFWDKEMTCPPRIGPVIMLE